MCVWTHILIFHHKLNFAKNVTYDLIAFNRLVNFHAIDTAYIILHSAIKMTPSAVITGESISSLLHVYFICMTLNDFWPKSKCRYTMCQLHIKKRPKLWTICSAIQSASGWGKGTKTIKCHVRNELACLLFSDLSR